MPGEHSDKSTEYRSAGWYWIVHIYPEEPRCSGSVAQLRRVDQHHSSPDAGRDRVSV